jgi:hypothetical protein
MYCSDPFYYWMRIVRSVILVDYETWHAAYIFLQATQHFEVGESRLLWLTTLPPSCADCHEIWEPQPPGTLRGLSRLVMGLLYLLYVLMKTDAIFIWYKHRFWRQKQETPSELLFDRRSVARFQSAWVFKCLPHCTTVFWTCTWWCDVNLVTCKVFFSCRRKVHKLFIDLVSKDVLLRSGTIRNCLHIAVCNVSLQCAGVTDLN